MRTQNQRDVRHTFVGKDVIGALGNIQSLVDGELGLFDVDGTRLDNTTFPTVDKFRIAGLFGNDLLASEFIKKADIDKVTLANYSAAVEQQDFIGYNGTAGTAIVVNSDTVYRVALMIKETIVQNHGGVYVKDMVYKSDATATQAEIAEGLAKSGLNNLKREAEKPLKIELVSDATVTALTPTVTVNKGAEYAVFSAAHGLAVGDFVEIGGVFYKVEAVPSTTMIKLSFPFQGASVAAAAANYITAATAATANWGIRLTGEPLAFALGKLNYKKSRWELSLDSASFGNTPVTNAAVAADGVGVGPLVAEEEWFSRGNFGEFFRQGQPYLFAQTFNADVNTNYDQYVLKVISQDKGTLTTVNDIKEFNVAAPVSSPNWASDATYGVFTLLATL